MVNGGLAHLPDGWLNYGLPVAQAYVQRFYRSRIKHPILVKHMRVIPGGGEQASFVVLRADVMYGPV